MQIFNDESKSLKIPEWMDEKETLDVIMNVAKSLARQFKFGYMGREDVEQEAIVLGLQSLEKYDKTRPLRQFLYVSVRRKLLNGVRKYLYRNDPPCKDCFLAQQNKTVGPHEHGAFCELFLEWKLRNDAKYNLMNTLGITEISHDREKNTQDQAAYVKAQEIQDTLDLIDLKVSTENRRTFLRMRDGAQVTSAERKALADEIRNILTPDEMNAILCLD